jgi:hypothetical protein
MVVSKISAILGQRVSITLQYSSLYVYRSVLERYRSPRRN